MKTKKFFSVVLALALVLGLSTTAFAEDRISTHTEMPANKDIPVTGSYSGTAADVYSVKIEWGEMSFTYKTNGNKTWDPATHTYDVAENDGWNAVGNEVKVTNHSNVPVNVAFSFTKDTSSYKGDYTGELSVNDRPLSENETKQLAAGVENKPNEADSVTCVLNLKGKLNYVEKNVTDLGKITVSLSAVTAQP